MESREIAATRVNDSVVACLKRQSVLIRSDGYWNCLTAARELAALLLAEGRRPWIARLRKRENLDGEVFHAPLIPRKVGIARAWTTHYVCCCDGTAYDPVAGRPVRLEVYCAEIFGEEIPAEVFVAPEALPDYLA